MYDSPPKYIDAMASIPLLCNICPKHPDFSDISHLLTHVSSKGHLSHYFKAQVRSRQEPQILQQLEIYDRWYDKHHIETLLSQRMVLKESKNINGNSRSAGSKLSASSKLAKGTKKSAKVEAALHHRSSHVKDENVIDPQLSQAHPTPSMASVPRQSFPLDLPIPDLPSQHRAYAPRMRAWPAASPYQQEPPQNEEREVQPRPRAGRNTGSESGSDAEQLFFRSPAKSIYPDPSTMSGLPQIGAFRLSPPVAGQGHDHNINELDTEEPMLPADDEESTQSPKLKGICWPGMDIFDSASPEAQRKRNQKKDDSILKQMELNSLVVEPLEQIYWPEGTLKKERLITGMVESSPLKEESPKPRRRRTTRDKRTLKNGSTNDPRALKTSGFPKISYPHEDSHPADLGDLSKRALAMLDSPSPTYLTRAHLNTDPAEDENVEWELTAGDPEVGRKRRFVVYDDDATEDEQEQYKQTQASNVRASQYPFLHRAYSQQTSIQSPRFSAPNLGIPFPTSGTYPLSHRPGYGLVAPREPDLTRQSHSLPRNRHSNSSVNKENIEPVFNSSGQIDDGASQAYNGRSSQRYFSITRGYPPEYFDTLPSHMIFGGWSGPRLSGSSLNPLNPSAQHHQVSQPYQHSPRISTAAPISGFSPLRVTRTSSAGDNHESIFSSRSLWNENKGANPRRERS